MLFKKKLAKDNLYIFQLAFFSKHFHLLTQNFTDLSKRYSKKRQDAIHYPIRNPQFLAIVSLAFISGIYAIYTLPVIIELSYIWLLCLISVLACFMCWSIHKHRIFYVLILVIAFLLGCARYIAFIEYHQPNVIETMYKNIKVTGDVKKVIYLSKEDSARIIVEIKELDGKKLFDDNTVKVQFKANHMYDKIQAGDTVGGIVSIFPLPQPLIPEQHNFSRDLWFKGIGGVGYFISGPYFIDFSLQEDSVFDSIMHKANRLQINIYDRLNTYFDKDITGFFFSLLSGNSKTLSKERLQILRETGLSHVLAVSGFHMGIIAGGAFWFVRLILSFFRWFALTYPIKKIACVCAISVSGFYLIFTHFSISATRAWIMVTVMFLAVIFDKKAFQLRNVALAAFLILVLTPQSVFSPGFQMSFLVVSSLIAANEAGLYSSHVQKNGQVIANAKLYKIFYSIRQFSRNLFLVSLISALASMPIIVFYFQTISLVSVAVNFIVLPLVMFVVIPFVFLGFVFLLFNTHIVYYVLLPAKYATSFIFDVTDSFYNTGYATIHGIDIENIFIYITVILLIFTCIFTNFLQKTMIASCVFTFCLGFFYQKPAVSFFILPLEGNIVFKSRANMYCSLKPIKNKFLDFMLKKKLLIDTKDLETLDNECQIDVSKGECRFRIKDTRITVRLGRQNVIPKKEKCLDDSGIIRVSYQFIDGKDVFVKNFTVPSTLGTVAFSVIPPDYFVYKTTRKNSNDNKNSLYGFKSKKDPWIIFSKEI